MHEVLIPGKQLVDGSVINDLANLNNLAYVEGLTALAGGGRDDATALAYGFNEIAVCATAADSCVLPPAVAGTAVYAANAGAASAKIYALGSDTINETAGSTGVDLAVNAAAWFVCASDTKWTAVGVVNNATITTLTATTVNTTTLAVSGYQSNSVATGLTATGTTRADALQLAKQINNLGTVAASTGVILPTVSSVGVGGYVVVMNNGAAAVQVYGSGADTIDGVAATTGVALTNAHRAFFWATAAATWVSADMASAAA